MIYPVRLKNRQDAIRVSQEASRADFDLSISSGTIILDPRSLLALFTLIGCDAYLIAPDNADPKEFLHLVKKMNIG